VRWLLLPTTELGILETLYGECRDLMAAEIAEDLDCSYQLVVKRGKIMEQKRLVHRLMEQKRRKFRLTEQAMREYFDGNESRRLNVGRRLKAFHPKFCLACDPALESERNHR
jgi:DNA-binding MarR family transcriptional regulator